MQHMAVDAEDGKQAANILVKDTKFDLILADLDNKGLKVLELIKWSMMGGLPDKLKQALPKQILKYPPAS
jgi:hypothetical protein